MGHPMKSIEGIERPSFAVVAVSALLAIVQLRLIVFIIGDGLMKSADAAHGVLAGRPHWRAFQNRILGPYLVESLRYLVGDDRAAHLCFMAICLAVAGVLAYLLGRQVAGSFGGALAFAVFQLGFVALLSPPWLYAWDLIGLIIFLLFVSFVAAERPVWWFVGLFAVAIFNRESAQFIALWLIVDPISRYAYDRFTGRADPRLNVLSLVVGFGCLLAGMALVESLRASLLIEELGPQMVGHPAAPNVVSFGIRRVLTNMYWIRRSFTDPGAYVVAVIPILFVAMIGLAVALVLRRP